MLLASLLQGAPSFTCGHWGPVCYRVMLVAFSSLRNILMHYLVAVMPLWRHFKSLKHARMGHATRLWATDFVLRQLQHILSKTKKLSLSLTISQLVRQCARRIRRQRSDRDVGMGSNTTARWHTHQWWSTWELEKSHGQTSCWDSASVWRMSPVMIYKWLDQRGWSCVDACKPTAELNDKDIECHMDLLSRRHTELSGITTGGWLQLPTMQNSYQYCEVFKYITI